MHVIQRGRKMVLGPYLMTLRKRSLALLTQYMLHPRVASLAPPPLSCHATTGVLYQVFYDVKLFWFPTRGRIHHCFITEGVLELFFMSCI